MMTDLNLSDWIKKSIDPQRGTIILHGEYLLACVKEYEARLKQLAKENAELLEQSKKLNKAIQALEEAVHLLQPTEKDMERRAGVYRIVTTLNELKENE